MSEHTKIHTNMSIENLFIEIGKFLSNLEYSKDIEILKNLLANFHSFDAALKNNIINLSKITVGKFLNNAALKIDVSGQYKLQLTDGGASITINIYPPLGSGEFISSKKIIERLNKSGVLKGIDKEAILKAVQKVKETAEPVNNIIIVKANPVMHGKDGYIEFVKSRFDRTEYFIYNYSDNLQSDYELNLFVNKKDKIGVLIQPENGINGIDVFGSVILAKNGRAIDISEGNNVIYDSVEKVFIACVDGCVVLKNRILSVENMCIINEDSEIIGNMQFQNTLAQRQINN